ncbi:MAG: metal ABC transporter ATP-binding protein [Synechococcaceae cyanobacterium SM2_3_2]|nr:metal ABC transporter ATP-binding protein [Synechococcaceae cyanobacterium SM2_3_2]
MTCSHHFHGDELGLDPPSLELVGVTLGYPQETILPEVSLQIPAGSLVAVIGPNGAGKSTFFKGLTGLLPPMQGSIAIHGLPLGHHRHCVTYVPQREEVDWRFPVTVWDVVMMGRHSHRSRFRAPSRQDRSQVMASLDQLGILPLAQVRVGELSGGQQQRVFLARALAQDPHIILMDEPFTGVDLATQEAMLTILHDLHQQGITVLVSSHDLSLAATRFKTVLLLNRGVVGYGSPEAIFVPHLLRAGFGSQAVILPNGGMIASGGRDPDRLQG